MIENVSHVAEVDAMLMDVDAILCLIPFEEHAMSVLTFVLTS
jgi:hypothetical protein